MMQWYRLGVIKSLLFTCSIIINTSCFNTRRMQRERIRDIVRFIELSFNVVNKHFGNKNYVYIYQKQVAKKYKGYVKTEFFLLSELVKVTDCWSDEFNSASKPFISI